MQYSGIRRIGANLFFALSVLGLFLTSACAPQTERKDERTYTHSDLLDSEAQQIDYASVPVIEGEEFSLSTEGEFGLANGAPKGNYFEHNRELREFFALGIKNILEINEGARKAVAVAIALRSLRADGHYQCLYFKGAWVDPSGVKHEKVVMPEGQTKDCAQQMRDSGRGKSRGSAGAIAAGVKLSPTTYAGAAGAGIISIGHHGIAGCAVGAAGIVSKELRFAAGIPGLICGSIPTVHAVHIHID